MVEDDDPWHFEHDLTRVPGYSTSPKRGGSSGCAGTSSWQKNIHTPTHVGQSMESRLGRSSVDPYRDREHVSNANSEGTYVGMMSLFTY